MKAMKRPTLLVLAAGLGSRYGGLKQIDPVGPNGETIIDYSIFDALRAGFGKLVFIIRKDIEQAFKESVSARFEKKAEVEYVFQELDMLPPGFTVPAGRTKPWGTTHAVLMAAGSIHEPFAVVNADDFYGAQSYRVLAQHLQSGTEDYAMVGFILRNTLSDFGAVSRGVCQVNGNGFLQEVVELTKIEPDGAFARSVDSTGHETRLTGDEMVSMNMWGFTHHVFVQLQERFQKFLEHNHSEMRAECYLPTAVNELVLAGQASVKVLRSMDSWFGVTCREDRARVVESISRLIGDGSYPKSLWS
jgi:dTDP-glucose pyrophosphorylase